jgi:hypothetical protein
MSKPAPPTPADDPILIALNDYHALTAEQVQRLFYSQGSRKYPQLRLAGLAASGYVLVDLPAPPRTAGRARSVYLLTPKGGRYLEQELELAVPKRVRPSEMTERSWSHYSHLLSVNDVLIAAELLTRRRPEITIVQREHDFDLKQQPIRVGIAMANPPAGRAKPAAQALIPDAFLLFAVSQGDRRIGFPVAVEIDKGMQRQKEWRAKIDRYLAAIATGAFAERFGVQRLSIAAFTLPNETVAIQRAALAMAHGQRARLRAAEAEGADQPTLARLRAELKAELAAYRSELASALRRERQALLREWTMSELRRHDATRFADWFLFTSCDPARNDPEAVWTGASFVAARPDAPAESLRAFEEREGG